MSESTGRVRGDRQESEREGMVEQDMRSDI